MSTNEHKANLRLGREVIHHEMKIREINARRLSLKRKASGGQRLLAANIMREAEALRTVIEVLSK